ncbi:MAG: DsbA family protein, partial [Candidatus Magasanikbacteria bacterium]|nr:DsbA family protein [Candidatus Magasanikbacteria bacterium]
ELGGNDAFWKYTDAIFERTTSNGTGFPLDGLVPLAKDLGLNESKFKSCLDNGKYAAHVQQDENGGANAGVNGTPGSFLIGKDGKTQLISGALPYEQIKAAIDAQLR